MKKRLIWMLLALSMVTGAYAQAGNSMWGVKLGLNYNGNGDYIDSATDAIDNPDRNVGYHLGVFGKLGDKIFVRPELVYTRTKSEYEQADLKISKLDLPVLLGLEVIGPLNVFAGPSFQYLLSTKLDDTKLENLESDITVGLNLGASVDIGNLGLEIRYERGFTQNEAEFIDSNIVELDGDRVDTRPDQLILSLSVKL